ncbi:hypothetical protein GGX14DRAFT_406765 [Mycena pura]|uniref:Uncharacterized protein n=1 Tax=Mycena pura TaxID=153505 RepID=A0AAD6UPI1_9AGAR|nr:hypothetical protein GGX14DRAFT_406765 [Mycena pura]
MQHRVRSTKTLMLAMHAGLNFVDIVDDSDQEGPCSGRHMTGVFDGDAKPHDGSDGGFWARGHSQDRARLERVPSCLPPVCLAGDKCDVHTGYTDDTGGTRAGLAIDNGNRRADLDVVKGDARLGLSIVKGNARMWPAFDKGNARACLVVDKGDKQGHPLNEACSAWNGRVKDPCLSLWRTFTLPPDFYCTVMGERGDAENRSRVMDAAEGPPTRVLVCAYDGIRDLSEVCFEVILQRVSEVMADKRASARGSL